jgi:hypothetical protein
MTCKNKLPHDYKPLYENPAVKVELCAICDDKISFTKDRQGRVDNNKYLDAHIRNFAQPTGRTAKLYYSIYHPELYNENKHRWTLNVCTSFTCNTQGTCNHPAVMRAVTIGDLGKKGTNAHQ